MNQQNNLQQQSSNFIATDNVVATSCLTSQNTTQRKFIVTGNGGLQQTPDNLELNYSVVQVLAVNSDIKNQVATKQDTWRLGTPIQEATQLVTTSNGRLLLQANTTKNYSEVVVCH